jgi:endo-1,4-beta-xylanase
MPVQRAIEASVVLRRPDGSLLPAGTTVSVEQRRHAFLFGTNGFEAVPLANDEVQAPARELVERTFDVWLEVFNSATLPFYWGRFEPERGRPDTLRLMAAARWFRERDVAVKGHPLCWHTQAPTWLLALSDEAVEAALRARIRRDVSDFTGVIDTWDAINEVVIMPRFEKEENGITRLAQRVGRVGMVRLAFEEARAANPGSFLLLNDFDLSAEYEELIADCLDAGIAIDAIGIQSHMHQGYWGEDETQRILERYARFGLPLHWTETTLVSGHLMPPEIVDLNDYQVTTWPSTPEGEERQAEEAARHYRTLFAHPQVEAIVWWDPIDGHWLNAPAGLLRQDGSPKPAFDALRALITGEWWMSPASVAVDDTGSISFRGAAGSYVISTARHSVEVEVEVSDSTPAIEAPWPA